MTTLTINNLPPGLILLLGALLVPLFRGRLRNWFVILLPALAFWQVSCLNEAAVLSLPFLDFELNVLRADVWSRAFGYIFTLNAFAAFLYGSYQKKSTEFVAALLYIGSALMVVFAGDLITIYLFWEAMAVTSVYLVLASKTTKALAAARRYILVHVVGGLVLLAGLVLLIHDTGSIAFAAFAREGATPATWLILIGFLINAAAVPFSSWLPDAYPESTVLGGVILSAYTSKTAVYTLVRGFPGWEILIVIGCAMTLYGIIYALLENDMRRILAYSIINQVGFMVVGVGIGTPLALAGTVAHAFCHIIYKALLWMSAGAVLYRTGRSKCTELGGLYNTMPWTLILGGIGALAISSVPLTSGFTSKTIIIAAAANQHLFWAWLILEIASAGVFLHAGIKFPYFVFFAKDSGLRPAEAPKSMLAGMGLLAFLCLSLGMFPERLYDILPNSELVKAAMPYTFSDIYLHHFGHVVTQSQMLIFSGLVFFLFLPLLKRTDTISLDFDWFYRKGGELFYHFMDSILNRINRWTNDTVALSFTATLSRYVNDGPARLWLVVVKPLWQMSRVRIEGADGAEARLLRLFRTSAFSIGSAAIFSIGLLLMLLLL
ncbi:MAG: Na(+)/H(+) antiporter subunit D [Thermodesulfobacteriota bacterium]